MKRILLFLVTNLAIILVLGVVLNIIFSVFGISSRSMGGLLILALIFGMGGSFISLAISKWIAKRSTGAEVIDEPQDEAERWLLKTVERQAKQAGIGMPEVAIYESADINAFATGMNRNNALVAVSSGLLDNMTEDEAEAVLGHEVSHVANGDMITLALIQGVVNTFVILLARVIGGIIDSAISGDEEGEGGGGLAYFAIVMVLELILGVLASTIVMWFSRYREFHADSGGARLAGREKMIAALQRLQQMHEPSHLSSEMVAFGISGKGSLASLFSSHPPLEDRIAALQSQRQA
ncbi:protease HtpX [Candidatus Venteria ishoeyi]|uniref:Protease HtpX n=1 Tax=Candidatus Venteria ishoeyi TaxID=1899563 RepID=A0A1H6F8C0_9GAMM|nr:protease HtpX [Candidatus Venteria ishoeyi]MDM8547334.1 protease HtpX [Candidatus Venteria ishoeyi]SEH06368.1 Protease HtpX [Candidatus Venteria ishoeyi]